MKNEDHHSFMGEALALAGQALDRGDFPVGCVVVSGGRVIASGARTGSRPPHANELDHAEMIALRRLADQGVSLFGAKASIYCTMEPCLMCYGAILLAGVERIVYGFEDIMGGAARCDRKGFAPLYRDNPVRVVEGVRRSECLLLFRRFFQNPENAYWQGSLLADYTLSQKKGNRA
ncbi:MAG: nucleoside deaminase [Desulfobacterales bacterium]|nr:nucleoside deaminase [Desulfobacterales bacterium]